MLWYAKEKNYLFWARMKNRFAGFVFLTGFRYTNNNPPKSSKILKYCKKFSSWYWSYL